MLAARNQQVTADWLPINPGLGPKADRPEAGCQREACVIKSSSDKLNKLTNESCPVPCSNKSTTYAVDAAEAEKALDMLISGSSKTAKKLLKSPSAPTPPSWHLCLPSHFNTALGLKFSHKQKVKDKQVTDRWKEWVQSGNFDFNEGSIIYDKDVYGLKTWGEKLAVIKSYVVIGKTRPVSLRIFNDEAIGFKKSTRDSGLVTFKIYVPDPDSSLKSICKTEITATQDEFVRFAISGKPPS